jgi:hypothetical protein
MVPSGALFWRALVAWLIDRWRLAATTVHARRSGRTDRVDRHCQDGAG